MNLDRDYTLRLMEACHRAETWKSSLNDRVFTGYCNTQQGLLRIDAKYTIFPQFISLTEVTVTKDFNKHTERYCDFYIKKDSDLGEHLLH